MLHTVHKLLVDYQKEEEWLNEMSKKGYGFISFSPLTYKFETCEPGKYIYRVELLNQLPTHVESQNYFEFSKELGIEVVDTSFRWVFFRKLASEGPFDIHTDSESKIKHHKSIMTLYGVAGFFNLAIGLFNLAIGTKSPPNTWLAFVNGGLGALIIYTAYQHYRRIQKLKASEIIYK